MSDFEYCLLDDSNIDMSRSSNTLNNMASKSTVADDEQKLKDFLSQFELGDELFSFLKGIFLQII